MALSGAEDKENQPVAKTSKKKTVEETYQKLTQLEHVLLRPDTYIGSVEQNRTKLWVFEDGTLVNREVLPRTALSECSISGHTAGEKRGWAAEPALVLQHLPTGA